MKPVKKITPPNWMISSQCEAVMNAIDDKNSNVLQAMFVGGCVRNMLLGEDVGDIDIATKHLPPQVTQRLEAAGIKVIPTGIDHGTITAVTDGHSFEITTLRKDVETDGRRAVVAFSQDWAEDAQRRDFTMNTLLADREGNIYDPAGKGLKALENESVVFVGDPAQRIAEDYLRILRFFRFHAFYGTGEPDKAGLAACAKASGKIKTLSKERITQEFFKILSVDNPSEILSLMFKNGVLKDFFFENYSSDFMKNLCSFQNRYGLAFIASRLFALAGLAHENIKTMEQLLLIPKVFKKDIDAIAGILDLGNLDNDHAVKVAVYKYGRVATAQVLMIELARDTVMNGYAPDAIKIIQNWKIPNLPVSGNDLIKSGYKPGPKLGQKLQEIEDWWIEQGFKPTSAECLAV